MNTENISGKTIIRTRLLNNMSQNKLAELLGISIWTLLDMENDQIPIPEEIIDELKQLNLRIAV